MMQDLEQRIRYFSDEHDLTVAETIGVLEILKHNLLQNAHQPEPETDTDEPAT